MDPGPRLAVRGDALHDAVVAHPEEEDPAAVTASRIFVSGKPCLNSTQSLSPGNSMRN